MGWTRREWLKTSTSACSLPLLAGCAATDSENSTPSGTAGNPEANFIESTIYTDDDGTKWIRARFRNPTGFNHGQLRVNHSVYNADDELIDSQEPLLQYLPAGETWLDYRHVLGQRRDEAASVETEVLTDDGQVSAVQIENINIIESTLNKGYQTSTEILGELENTGDAQDGFRLIGLVYTDDGTLRGSVGTFISQLDAGETRSFRAAIAGTWTPENQSDSLPTQHELYAFESLP